MPDMKQMISEVFAENGIRIEPGDPLFALVTMNRMVFEESAQRYYESNQQLIAEFNESMKKAEMRAGSMLAKMVKESAEKMREGLQGDIHIAGLKATRIRTRGERGPPSSCDCTLGLRWVSGCRSDIRLRRLVWTLFPLVGTAGNFSRAVRRGGPHAGTQRCLCDHLLSSVTRFVKELPHERANTCRYQ